MSELELLTRPLELEVRSPRLCGTVAGVEFWLRQPGSRDLRCVITDGALSGHYGAGSEPGSWIEAFMCHRQDIEKRALAGTGRRHDVHVVLLNDALGQLQCAAVRRIQ